MVVEDQWLHLLEGAQAALSLEVQSKEPHRRRWEVPSEGAPLARPHCRQHTMKLREIGHKNRKIELIPNKVVSKNFVFILIKGSIIYLLISPFDRSCFKINLNGRFSNQRTTCKRELLSNRGQFRQKASVKRENGRLF